VIFYNGRRKFEVLKLHIDDLVAAEKDTKDTEALKHFTPEQKKIAQDIYCLLNVGKCYAEVPTLMTSWMKSMLISVS
jgi:hypothetical protein